MAKSRADRHDLEKISRAAHEALARFPSEREIEQIPNQSARRFLSNLRHLVAQGRGAATLSEDELYDFALQVEWVSSAASTGIALMAVGGSGGGDGESCTARCVREKEECLDRECGTGPQSFPCFCCVDCRLAYLACLAGCVVHGFEGGGYTYA
jgi:hypothetical protein